MYRSLSSSGHSLLASRKEKIYGSTLSPILGIENLSEGLSTITTRSCISQGTRGGYRSRVRTYPTYWSTVTHNQRENDMVAAEFLRMSQSESDVEGAETSSSFIRNRTTHKPIVCIPTSFGRDTHKGFMGCSIPNE